jgi:AcrR family transcriptional regulator
MPWGTLRKEGRIPSLRYPGVQRVKSVRTKKKAAPAVPATRPMLGKAPVTIRRKRQRLPAAERREQVINAAKAVFIRKGFHGTKTRDLAEEAGVNEATLFLYFKSKQDIFNAAITNSLRDIVKQQMKEGRAFATAPREQKGRIGIQANREILESVAEMYPLLVASLFADGEIGRDVYRRDIYPMVKRLRAATKVSFDLDDDAQAEFVALAAFGLSFSMLLHHELLGAKIDMDKTAERIANLLLFGAFKRSAD